MIGRDAPEICEGVSVVGGEEPLEELGNDSNIQF